MSAPATERVELPITGMTCASCANRIERRLNKLDGVTATVNYATEKATVTYDPAEVAPERLVSAVESAGYGASLPSHPAAGCSSRRSSRSRPCCCRWCRHSSSTTGSGCP
jgi:Cu+-exporting ATPase